MSNEDCLEPTARHPAHAPQSALPMLRARLPASHSALAEWLLLQGDHGRLPHVAAGAPTDAGGAYAAAAAAFADRWSTPARLEALNALERVGRVGRRAPPRCLGLP